MKEIGKRLKSFCIGIIAFLLYFEGVPLLLNTFFKNFFRSKNAIVSNVSLVLGELCIFLVLFIIFRKKIINDIKNFKKDSKKNLDTGFKYYFVGLLVMIASNIILSLVLGNIAANESANREYLKMYPFYSIVAMIFIGPIVEEIVFRLGFRDTFKNWLPYAIFSALFFGGLHVYTAYDGMTLLEILKNWEQMLYVVPYGALGFAFAKTYYDTNNICTSMIIHMLHNGFTIFLIFFAI